MTEARDDLQALQDRIAFLEEQLAEAQLATQRAEEMAVSLAGTAKATNDAANAQTERLRAAQSELTAAKQEQVKQKRVQLETDDLLIQKMAVIAAQAQQIRQLTAEKAEMQVELDHYLNPSGEAAATTPPAEQAIKPKGQVTAVDIPNGLAEISIGRANGVKKEMIFRVTRGDQFVCNILIVDVDTEKAVGDIQSAQLSPQVGDSVSVNLDF